VKAKLSSLEQLSPSSVSTVAAPPLEAEAPHKRLARLNRELTETVETLQALKKAWAEKNVKMQACRQAVSTPEVTHHETHKRELALRLLDLQTQIGALNRELRLSKASAKAPRPRSNGAKLSKKCPLKDHSQYAAYFLLAARDQLHPDLYDQVERTAKSMLQHALGCGLEEA
jgi:chromosome segregation ATPase